jgi:hypothetical protein
VRPPARGHLRLARCSSSTTSVTDAIAEAKARAGAGAEERSSLTAARADLRAPEKFNEAIAEWNTVLALADRRAPRAEQHGALRREARVRLLGLLARQGRTRIDAQIRQLREDARQRPDDPRDRAVPRRGAATQGDPAGAIATLQGRAGAGDARAHADDPRDVIVEAGFALVHL